MLLVDKERFENIRGIVEEYLDWRMKEKIY